MTAEDILRSFEKAKADRTVVESTWEDIIYHVNPRKRGINTKYEPGEKPSWDVYDDTPQQSNLTLAAGLSGYMTNSSQRWFELRTRDEALMNDNAVRSFFNKSAEIMYAILADSNFYQQIHETYLDLGALGNCALYEEEDVKNAVRFYARHPREVYFVEDHREEVNLVFRSFPLTAWQAVQFFGEQNVSEAVYKAVYEDKDYNKKFNYVHHVCPRYKREAGKQDGTNKPFASFWVEVESKKIIKEGGYDEFPFMCGRFYKNSGEVYGYGPGNSCYSDILMLNKSVETYIKGAEIAIYPPWLAEHDGIMGTLDLRAGAINYQRQPLSQGQAVQPLGSNSNFQVGIDFIQRAEAKIKSAFFVDLFLMLSQTNNMTATEVMERTNEKMLIMGPVLGRLQSELLSPVIARTFNILMRNGKLPPMPQELQGKEYDVVYVSPLAKAQRAAQAKDMQTFLMIIGQMAQAWPDVLHKVKSLIYVDKLSKIYSVDPDIVADDEEAEASIAAQQEAMAQQQKMVALQQAADIAKTGGQAGTEFAKAKALSTQK
jgi:hypothetical protein